MKSSEEKQELNDLLELSDVKKKSIINNILSSDILYESIDVADDVYKDTKIDIWSESLTTLDGSKMLINKLVKNPISDKEILLQRQKSYSYIDIEFETLKAYEDDVLWVYKLNQEIKENNLINVLFPSSFVISYINHVAPLLDMYQMYKIYMIPANVIIYPIISILSPWYYVNRYLKFNLSISTYVEIIFKFFKFIFTFSNNIRLSLLRIIISIGYVLLFAYNAYQTIEYSYMLYNIRNTLMTKLYNMNEFLSEAIKIIKSLPSDIVKSFIKVDTNIFDIDLTNKSSNIYKLWKDDNLKSKISNILLTIYTIDIIHSISKLKTRKNWCLTNYTNTSTQMWNMKNPVLPCSQVANPANLEKNIVITGPNAAGKTTYVKSILSNVILSQSLGISYALYSNSILYDTIASFMRITDILGSKSYFEVEAEYCTKMMNKAQYLEENNKMGLFMMDEPMHSTPPTEGMSTAFAVAEYIGNMKCANIILTTHFHKLTHLQSIYPNRFINLSVEAVPKENGFDFPYTIRRGHSYQCIAIELLSTKLFPDSVIQSAINMKNKICNEINSR